MEIRKAVVTAAGWGTRFLPATKSQPKEMLPLVDRPIIHYAVEEAVASGIQQVIIVTALGKHALEDYFDRSFELEYFLEKKGNGARVAELRHISELADISYVRQKGAQGLGHAVLTARGLVGDEPFALFLPDDIIEAPVPGMKQMLEVYQRYRCSILAVEAVPHEEVSSYGVIDPVPVEERLYQVKDLVEKPDIQEAPSDLAIVGRYILTPQIFDALEHTPPGRNNELQLTDGLRLLLKQQAIYAYQIQGVRYDTGTPLGLLKASVEAALRRPDMGPQFRRYLQSLKLGRGGALSSSKGGKG